MFSLRSSLFSAVTFCIFVCARLLCRFVSSRESRCVPRCSRRRLPPHYCPFPPISDQVGFVFERFVISKAESLTPPSPSKHVATPCSGNPDPMAEPVGSFEALVDLPESSVENWVPATLVATQNAERAAQLASERAAQPGLSSTVGSPAAAIDQSLNQSDPLGSASSTTTAVPAAARTTTQSISSSPQLPLPSFEALIELPPSTADESIELLGTSGLPPPTATISAMDRDFCMPQSAAVSSAMPGSSSLPPPANPLPWHACRRGCAYTTQAPCTADGRCGAQFR